ncbi:MULTISPECIES: hypothetical protein [unclassified Bacillus (in: firmicutes)]|uniref:hypothetical protein n=1 Tax=unclassified Bacillus (in: firmicutes) TaxID=185979 RepID=UPI00227EA345|nr:hypothetical protein [Bacillus sp. S20C3]MCY8288965.1 hypothetical protein [Bacillus sp. N13C7]MCY8638130.1 hypothetical protein [Bacillus sp. S17B2]MCY9142027.1 hypothetical protein [Bacillus sp. T9C1]
MAARYPQEAVLLEKRGMDIIALQGSGSGRPPRFFSAGQRGIRTWPYVFDAQAADAVSHV